MFGTLINILPANNRDDDELIEKPDDLEPLKKKRRIPLAAAVSTKKTAVNICFKFSQTGRCRLNTNCNFLHVLPRSSTDQDKYTKYELTWTEDDDEEDVINKQALAATLNITSKFCENKLQEEHVCGTPILFSSRKNKRTGTLPKMLSGEGKEKEKSELPVFEDILPESEPAGNHNLQVIGKRTNVTQRYRRRDEHGDF